MVRELESFTVHVAWYVSIAYELVSSEDGGQEKNLRLADQRKRFIKLS